jgi:hypothetical protein
LCWVNITNWDNVRLTFFDRPVDSHVMIASQTRLIKLIRRIAERSMFWVPRSGEWIARGGGSGDPVLCLLRSGKP